MHFNQILAITATLVAVVLSVVVYLNSENGTTWEKSEWTIIESSTGETQTWYVDLDQGIRMVTETATGDNVQDIVGDKLFTYNTVGKSLDDVDHSSVQCESNQGVNCDALRQLMAMDFTLLSEGVKDRKTSCHVMDVPTHKPVAVKNGTVMVAGFDVTVVDNVPVSLKQSGVVTHEIVNVTPYTKDLVINGCNDDDANIFTRSMMEVSESNHNRMLTLGSAYTNDLQTARQYLDLSYANFSTEEKSDRQLQFDVAGILHMITDTYWCGPGTVMDGTRCWNRFTSSQDVQENGDQFCFRHDHAGSSNPYHHTVMSGCDADDDLQSGSANFLEIAFGPAGASSTWGCKDWIRTYTLRWRFNRRWWGGYWSAYWTYRDHSHFRTGVSRYVLADHRYGYTAKVGPNYAGDNTRANDRFNGGGNACGTVFAARRADSIPWNLNCPPTQTTTKNFATNVWLAANGRSISYVACV